LMMRVGEAGIRAANYPGIFYYGIQVIWKMIVNLDKADFPSSPAVAAAALAASTIWAMIPTFGLLRRAVVVRGTGV